eukprot:UN22303
MHIKLIIPASISTYSFTYNFINNNLDRSRDYLFLNQFY